MLPTGYGTEGIAKQVKAISDARAEAAARKFVPGVQKVYGIRMPMLNAIVAEVKKNATPSFILSLWKSGAFEEKILAAKLVGRISKKQPGHALQMVERFSAEIHEWVVCDTLGMQSLKPIAQSHQEEIFVLATRLNRADTEWQRRLSMVLVELYTQSRNFSRKSISPYKTLLPTVDTM